jgi:hypothetical protein
MVWLQKEWTTTDGVTVCFDAILVQKINRHLLADMRPQQLRVSRCVGSVLFRKQIATARR